MTTIREAAQMAYAVPLHELLATVPRDARLVIEDADGKGTRFIPVGRYCHEAAEALRAALAADKPSADRLAQLEQEPQWRDAAYRAMDLVIEKQAQPEQEPVGNTITFMTRAIFNVVASHQEVNGGYFIADGDVAAFVDRLAKVINSTFEPLKPKNTAPPQREWQGLTDEEAFAAFGFHLWPETFLANAAQELKDTHEEAKKEVLSRVRAIEAKLKEKNT